ncbi:MAG TPA: hypothetical protein VFM48_01010 [Aquabacterium sp.]|nr:hypothetical protein [Aquabacterium sp.]
MTLARSGLFVLLCACVAAVSARSLPSVSTAAWREVHVDRLVSEHEALGLVSPSQDCRKVAGAGDADHPWLLVHFRRSPLMVYRVVPASDKVPETAGQELFVNLRDCQAHPLVRAAFSMGVL